MTPQERRSTLTLAFLFACRMLGLFMVLPVFMVGAMHLSGATPYLAGLALGIYGLMQAMLQIPGGWLSDRIGRKPVITAGFTLFVVGSCVAAFSHSIVGVIVGRALQGSGAVGSTMMALLADLTSTQSRTQAMAIVGMVIGLSCVVAMLAGPVVQSLLGWSGLFGVMAALGVCAIIMVWVAVPTPKSEGIFHYDVQCAPRWCLTLLKHPVLRCLNGSIALLHAVLTASFMAIPMMLHHDLKIHVDQQWTVYVPVLLTSCIVVFPAIRVAERRQKTLSMMLGAIVMLLTSTLLLCYHHTSLSGVWIDLLLFFISFNFLEAVLPSMVSKAAPAGYKGTAMGLYSTCQFLGIFIGGTLGGWVQQLYGIQGLLLLCSGWLALWGVWAAFMPKLQSGGHLSLAVPSDQSPLYYQKLIQLLVDQKGVYTAVIQDNGIAYLKIDTTMVDRYTLQALIQSPAVEAFEYECQ